MEEFYTARQIVEQGLLKKLSGESYSRTQTLKYLIMAPNVPNNFYFPKAEKVEGEHGLEWRFSSIDIDLFNKFNRKI